MERSLYYIMCSSEESTSLCRNAFIPVMFDHHRLDVIWGHWTFDEKRQFIGKSNS